MKPAAFRYTRPDSVAEAVELLASHGDDAAVLAGGQSLVPMLNMRLSTPALVVDVNRLDALKHITVDDGRLRVGALARHGAVESSQAVAVHAPLIHQAIRHVGHPAIRNRGTFGGSLALADPAAEIPACVCALDGEIVVAGPDGTRTVAAGSFFRGIYETDLAPGELRHVSRCWRRATGPHSPNWRGGTETMPSSASPPTAASSKA